MSQSNTHVLLFGAAAGMAIGAALIGLLLLGIAVAIDLQAATPSMLTQHPLFISGSELIYSSLLAGVPLFAVWYSWRNK